MPSEICDWATPWDHAGGNGPGGRNGTNHSASNPLLADHIPRMFEERRAIVGDFELARSFRFGGTPFELAESGLKLYAKKVLPVLHTRKQGRVVQAAE